MKNTFHCARGEKFGKEGGRRVSVILRKTGSRSCSLHLPKDSTKKRGQFERNRQGRLSRPHLSFELGWYPGFEGTSCASAKKKRKKKKEKR